jgi:hypothetical protein
MRQRFIEAKSVPVSSKYPSFTRVFFSHDIPKRLNATIKGGWGRRIRNQGKRAGQVERKQMMYKGGRFARGRVENERARGGPNETVRHALCAMKERKRQMARERERGRERE